MLKDLYTEIPIHYEEVEFYFKSKGLIISKVPASTFQFSNKDTSHLTGFIELLKDTSPYISGRHIFLDNLVFKGVGISKFYNLKKKRSVLGGLDFKSSLREFINNRVLALNNLTDIEVKALGCFKDSPEHHFVVKDYIYPRLGFVANSKLSQNDKEKIKL